MNHTTVSQPDGVAKKQAVARFAGKRAHSASPLRPLQPADPAKKVLVYRRCTSLTRPIYQYAKGAVGSSASADPTYPLQPDCCSTPDFNPTNEGGAGIKTNGERSQTAMVKMQRTLTMKKREYMKLRKSLIPQQNTLIEMYASIRDLEQRVGCLAENVGDLRVVSLTSWPPHDLLMLLRDDLHFPTNSDISGVFGPQVLQQLFAKLSPVPDEVKKMGEHLMEKRMQLVALVRKSRAERAYANNQEEKAKNMELDSETNRLRKLINGTAEKIRDKINESLELAKVPWLDRDRNLKKIDRLQKDMQMLQLKLEEIEENQVSQDIDSNPAKDAVFQEELAKERAAREASKELVAAAETMLRAARSRISSLERQLKESKAELDAAHRKNKELEQFVNKNDNRCRHRETSYDARSKKLIELSKTGEMTIDILSRQRDAYELRIKELREQKDSMEQAHKTREAELRAKVESLQSKLADMEKKKQIPEARAADLETKVKELEEVIRNVCERSGALVDIERRRCLEYLPKKESEPTDRETELWKELQTERLSLMRAEEELRQCRADKENFLASLSKIAQEGEDNLQERMAIELLKKERKISKLQQVIHEQRDNEKLMEQSMTQYENQLASLRLEVKRLRNYECYPKEEHSYQELETELLEMNMRVEELSRERSALVSAAASRALMLERHERAADLFSRVTRARRDLAAFLDGRPELPAPAPATPAKDLVLSNDEKSRDRRPKEVCSLSSVCVSAMETWTALRAERTRVLRLESAVLAQSLALEREGRVRTQLERRRALLERELLHSHSATAYDCAYSGRIF